MAGRSELASCCWVREGRGAVRIRPAAEIRIARDVCEDAIDLAIEPNQRRDSQVSNSVASAERLRITG